MAVAPDPGTVEAMDLTQLVITVLAVLGIALMGAMAVVPTVLDLTGGDDRDEPAARPVPARPVRDSHQLAA